MKNNMLKENIVFISGARTPFGSFGGKLKHLSAIDLGVVAAKEALKQANVLPEKIQHVIFGNVIQTSGDAIYLARHIGLKSGIPIETPALTVNRLCGSGFEAIVQGARQLILGEAQIVLAGGTESMSQAPHCSWDARWGKKYGDFKLTDLLLTALTDSYCGCPMSQTAENLAERYGISKKSSDEYALLSQQRVQRAVDKGKLAEEIVPVEITDRKGVTTVVDKDEHPRPESR